MAMDLKRFMMLGCILLASVTMKAQQLCNLWQEMPDSIIPLLNKSMRIELSEYMRGDINADNGVGEFKGLLNSLNDSTFIYDCSHDFLWLRLTASSQLEMKILPRERDSVICVVHTYLAPAAESTIAFYDFHWNKLQNLLPEIKEDDLICKPDSMEEDMFIDAKALLEPKMIRLSLSKSEYSVAASYSIPLMSDDDKRLLNTILLQKKFKWNGAMFN